MIGQTLSHYRIVEKLGSGGMGEVYVAEDTKLSRKVALKILPPEMAENAERRARFEREAKAVAALDHPNIVTIYSVEEAEGVHFYTMQLVKGKTLTELIPKKGMTLNKFLDIAIPLADAVSAAHEQGIIHRDLKPDNLMVSDEGRLKILDFGLAKLKPEYAEDGASELPTQSATAEGRILGTVAYMSPEQAEGKTVDNRSDIFSIGIILYAMATGERPFKGDTAASLLSSILRDTPQSATELNPELPRDLWKIIRRSLAKDPEDRLQTAKELRNELRELKQDLASGELLEGAPTTIGTPNKWLPHIALVVAIVLAGIVLYQLRLGDLTDKTTPLPIQGALTKLTSQPGLEFFPSLSPDGAFFVYASLASGNWDIYLQRVGGQKAINLTENSPATDSMPAYSPDGRHIAFRSERGGGGIFMMEATGESVRRLTDFGYNPAWSSDGENIVFATASIYQSVNRSTTSQLWALNISSGEKRLITESDAVQPSWSPSGTRIAYWAHKGGLRDIWTMPAEGGEAVAVTDDAFVDWNPVWSSDGRYLYFSSDRGGSFNIWRVSIDERSGKVFGTPQPVTTGGSAERTHIGFSKDGGRLAYIERTDTVNIWKVALESTTGMVDGEPRPISLGTGQEGFPSVSPDDRWLAFGKIANRQADIYIMRTDGSERLQLTNDIHIDSVPLWSPDGKKISFHSNRGGIHDMWTINPDGSGLTQLTQVPEWNIGSGAWSPSGTHIAYYSQDGNCYILDANRAWNEQEPQPLRQLEDGQRFQPSSWSPDEEYLAGIIHPRAGIVIYCVKSGQYRRLTDTGWLPRWLTDSRRLLFLHGGELYILNIESGKVPERILSVTPDQIHSFSVSGDGRQLYFARESQNADIWMLTLNEERE